MKKSILYKLATMLQDRLGLDPRTKESPEYCYGTLAHLMAYACECNADTMFDAIPDFGIADSFRRALISDEIAREHGSTWPIPLQMAIADLTPAEQKQIVNADIEVWLDTHKALGLPKLPRVMQIITSHLPKGFEPAVVLAMLPALGALATNVRFIYPDNGKTSSFSFISCIIGPPASGKSTIIHLLEPLLEPIKQEEKESNGRRIVGEIITLPKLVEELDDAKGKHLISHIHEVSYLHHSLTSALRYAFDNDPIVYSTKSGGNYNVPVCWNLLVAGTPKAALEFFNITNVENGSISRICFAQVPYVLKANRQQMVTPLSDKELEAIELTALELWMLDHCTISCKTIDLAIFSWKQARSMRLTNEDKTALLPIVRRAAEIGFRAGLLCYLLEKDQPAFTLNDMANFATWVAEYIFRVQVQLFGHAYEKADKQNKAILHGAANIVAQESTKMGQVLAILEHEFTRDEFVKAYALTHYGKTASAKCDLSRMKSKNLIEEIGEGRYRKNA